MSKAATPKPKAAAPAADAPVLHTPSPIPASPQVSEPTGAVEVSAATAAASVGPIPDARPIDDDAVPVAIVTVKGPEKGRWRIGRYFGPAPVEIPLADLSADDVEALKADAELLCIWPEA